MEFYVVGKTVIEKDIRLAHIKATSRGWNQVCYDTDQKYDFEYLNKENIPSLMEWFKIDFSEYRFFDDFSEAQAYKEKKIS